MCAAADRLTDRLIAGAGLESFHCLFTYEFGDDGTLHGMDLVTGAPLPTPSGHGSPSQDVPSSSEIAFTQEPTTLERADMAAATAEDAPNASAPAPLAMDTLPPPIFTGFEQYKEDGDTTAMANGLEEEPEEMQPAAQNPNGAPALDGAIAFEQPINHVFVPDIPIPDGIMEGGDAPIEPQPRMSAFARLRFSDGSYYMHTYQIILGRNLELARRDQKRLKKAEKAKKEGNLKKAEAILRGKKRHRTFGRPRSVISAVGGIVNVPMSAMPAGYQQRRQSEASHSVSSSSHRHEESQEEHVDVAPQDEIMQAFEEVPEQIDPHVPENPNEIPFVPIHPQHLTTTGGVRAGPNAISREHARIYYNFDSGAFDIEVLSSNGLYHEDQFYKQGEVIELNHGDTIVIGMVEMTFFLPDCALNDAQRARQDSGSRPMSFSFENGQGEIESDDLMEEDSASEEASVDPRHLFHMPMGPYDSEEDVVDEEEDEDDEEEDDDDSSSPEPRPRKYTSKPKLKIKLKNKSKAPVPPLRKEAKNGLKRKSAREPTPEEPEPTAKRARTKQKEAERVLPKDKGKAPAKHVPAKMPAKIPAKEPSQVKAEKADPGKASTSESPTLARRPTIEGRGSGDEAEQEGTITAEMVKRHNLPEALIGMVMEKRKGPGRPPKDGVMSKRQRAQLVKQGKEIEKARAAGIDPADIPIPITKPKVARPRKDSNANADGEDEDIRETTEKGDGTANSSDKKQAKPNKPPRTPSPEMRIEDYTEEQLQRPSANYVVLIHEAISSSKTGQMNLQQIYNYIERKYPWYKFKTTTSGWQSSVRHNLGQHDAFVKGDKEGKGFNWRINPEVSIEKERRKRQVSPQASHAQRQGYYPPPNGYPPYGHPGPYYPGVPQAGTNGAQRPPPPNVETVQPRLPPSLARNAGAAATPAQGPPNPSPYSSPWAGGNTAGSPGTQNPPRPFPQPSSQTPPTGSAAAPSGQYGVLFPTSAPQTSTYGNQYATAGGASYANGPNRPYTPYAATGTLPTSSAPYPWTQHSASQASGSAPHPSGRYPPGTNPELIHQLEAFRTVYLEKTSLPKAEEEAKVDRVLTALVNPSQAPKLTDQEEKLLQIIADIETIKRIGVLPERKPVEVVKQESNNEKASGAQPPSASSEGASDPNQEAPKMAAASTAAAIAASDAAVAASVLPNNPPVSTTNAAPDQNKGSKSTTQASTNANQNNGPQPPVATASASTPEQPQKSMPNIGGGLPSNSSAPAMPSPIRIQTSRPSVEPLTPVPGSPAVSSTTAIAKKDAPGATEQKATEAGALESPQAEQAVKKEEAAEPSTS